MWLRTDLIVIYLDHETSAKIDSIIDIFPRLYQILKKSIIKLMGDDYNTYNTYEKCVQQLHRAIC